MKRASRYGDETVALSAADMERFRRCAPSALQRRLAGMRGEELWCALEQMVRGAVPIVGMWKFGWSGEQMLLFLLVGAWAAILADAVKLWSLPDLVQRRAQKNVDHWHVWVVAQALREGRSEAPRSHLQVEFTPWLGVAVDFLFGGVGTIGCWALLAERQGEGTAVRPLVEPGVGLCIAAFVALEAARVALEIWQARRDADPHGEVSVHPGLRGVGLFLLLFLVGMIRDWGGNDNLVPAQTMLAINGIVLALGVLRLEMIRWGRKETRWLREYLAQHRE